MNLDQLVSLLDQLTTTLRGAELGAGDVLHTLMQLRDATSYLSQGLETKLNQSVVTQIQTASGAVLELQRVVDVVAVRADGIRIHLEEKSGDLTRAIPTVLEGFRTQNTQFLHDMAAGATGTVQNIWKFADRSVEDSETLLRNRLMRYATFMQEAFGASDREIKRAVESFRFEDAFGGAIEFTWSPDGPIARKALKAASHSPDFHPAMEVLFGPSGKVADAATDAAHLTNLSPAEQALETKLETGITEALDKAGTAGHDAAAGKLGEKISSGASALGSAMTAIPQLYESVTKLDEAWHKPLNSTQDYMNLLAAAGSAVSQVGATLQAFTGITQVASATQAVFNAVMAMNPVVLIVIAVIALIAAIALLIIYWDQVKAALRDNPWLAVAASLLGIIGIIVVIIAYWDEIKLAVLQAANYISIQAQRIGYFFVGVGRVIGQVWDWITATVANVGIAIVNAFITAGVAIQNFFIGVINWILGKYNDLADSALGDLMGLDKVDLIPEVDVQTKLIPPRDVPTIDVNAAFTTPQITGGLEAQIATQQGVVAAGQREDADRRARAAASAPPTAPPAVPGVPGVPAAPALAPQPPALPAAPGGVPSPSAPGAGAGGSVDQSVHVEGGITVNVNAERLEADSARLLTDQFVAQLQARLGDLRATQDFRVGARPQQA